ncbi:MAG: hypothetical protein PVF59_10425 [Desulfobacterales bacterium]|jgi:hypothetical protein
MRALMMAGLVVVLLIIGILTMRNMGVRSVDGETETQARDYVERAEDVSDAVEEKMQALEDRLNQAN